LSRRRDRHSVPRFTLRGLERPRTGRWALVPREHQGASPGRSVRRVGGVKTGSGGQARTPISRPRLFNVRISDIDSNSFRYADRRCGLTWGIAFDIGNPTFARRKTPQNRLGPTDPTRKPSSGLACVSRRSGVPGRWRMRTLSGCVSVLGGRWRQSRIHPSTAICKEPEWRPMLSAR